MSNVVRTDADEPMPTLGRLVRYVTAAGREYPALVVGTPDTAPELEDDQLNLFVFTEISGYPVRFVVKGPEPSMWHWPPGVTTP